MIKKLDENSKCMVIAPSDTVASKDLEELTRGEGFLKSLGLEILHSKNLMKEDYKLKAKDVEEAFKSDVDIIIAAKGGNNLVEILPYIDYTCISSKILCGFSDLTSLLNQISYKGNIITFHGCNAKTFGRIEDEKMDERTFLDFKKKFFDNDFSYSINLKNLKGSGKFTGKIVGGNLSCFNLFLENNKEYDLSNKIIILEELGFESNKEDIKGNLRKLSGAKGFENISGILIGNYECTEDEKYTLEEIILEEYEKYNINLVKGDFFGHSKLNLIIPIGALAKVQKNILIIEDEILEKK